MSGLVEFLMREIAADEAVARAAVGTAAFSTQTGRWEVGHPGDRHGDLTIVFAISDTGAKTQAADLTAAWDSDERGEHIARWDPARVLAECEAKRRIVDRAQDWYGPGWWPDDILRALAIPYADRPGFREEWRA